VKRHIGSMIWGYLVELLLVGLAYIGLLAAFGEGRLENVVTSHWQTFCVVAGVLLGVGFTGLLFFGNVLQSEFGKYLKWRKADERYLHAYRAQAILFLCAVIAPLAGTFLGYRFMTHVTWIVALYAGVNGLTVIVNTGWLIKLRLKFRWERDAFLAETHEDDE